MQAVYQSKKIADTYAALLTKVSNGSYEVRKVSSGYTLDGPFAFPIEPILEERALTEALSPEFVNVAGRFVSMSDTFLTLVIANRRVMIQRKAMMITGGQWAVNKTMIVQVRVKYWETRLKALGVKAGFGEVY